MIERRMRRGCGACTRAEKAVMQNGDEGTCAALIGCLRLQATARAFRALYSTSTDTFRS